MIFGWHDYPLDYVGHKPPVWLTGSKGFIYACLQGLSELLNNRHLRELSIVVRGDFTMVSNLPFPKRLLKLIETGRWPRTHEEELHQNLRPLVPKERIQSTPQVF